MWSLRMNCVTPYSWKKENPYLNYDMLKYFRFSIEISVIKQQGPVETRPAT